MSVCRVEVGDNLVSMISCRLWLFDVADRRGRPRYRVDNEFTAHHARENARVENTARLHATNTFDESVVR